jgi:uncharacterized membrane protein
VDQAAVLVVVASQVAVDLLVEEAQVVVGKILKIYHHYQQRKLVQAIQEAEKGTTGEIKIHLSSLKHEEDRLFQNCQLKFFELQMQNTQERNAVLIYVNPYLKQLALYGDVGIHQKLSQSYWEQLIQIMIQQIQSESLYPGLIEGIRRLGLELKQLYPASDSTPNPNEISNNISE